MPENNIELAGNTNIKTSQVDKSVDTPADFTSPEVLYNKLIETIRQYHPSSDLSDIERAYKVAKEAHEGQFRKSGEPYIIHPLCVAIILAEFVASLSKTENVFQYTQLMIISVLCIVAIPALLMCIPTSLIMLFINASLPGLLISTCFTRSL